MRRISRIVAAIGLILLSLVALGAIGVFVVYQSRVVTMPPVERAPATAGSYRVVDTGQSTFWDSAGNEIQAPVHGAALYGQDAAFTGNAPSYTDNGDGTVSDNVTGLMWTQTVDRNGDGKIDTADKLTLGKAVESVGSVSVGGYTDWRLPTIKELYSLIDFNGVDPIIEGTDTSDLTPFIDTRTFGYGYGDTTAGDRIIDAQIATSTLYVDKTFQVLQAMFGVNFADGRIKGYPPSIGMTSLSAPRFYILYVRDNQAYGVNDFADNGDGTITDAATALMWARDDSGTGMDWEHALAWAQQKNAESYLGHDDWRLPNIKELHSIVDYSRAPGVTGSAAIDPLFHVTAVTSETGASDYGFYWSSTTHVATGRPGGSATGAEAAYVCFGRCMGKMFGLWMDVHGAGAQRSDPKAGAALDYPNGRGPQGDAIRIDNLVRLVRDAD
jgi:hypothetical protein